MKHLYLALVICFLCPFSEQSRRGRRKVDILPVRSTQFPRTMEASKVRVSLQETSAILPKFPYRGLLSISFNEPHTSYLVCFPENFETRKQVYFLAHALCRQLGFMSLQDIHTMKMDQEGVNATGRWDTLEQLLPNSWKCEGHEQAVSQCKWNNIQGGKCSTVTKVACKKCEETFTADEGFMKSPGFPDAHLYDMTCEWHIESVKDHSIRVTFTHGVDLLQEQSDFHCSVDKPYVEIISYENQDHNTVNTICDFRKLNNVTIATNRLRIRYFSGIYNPKAKIFPEVTGGGIAVHFHAIPTYSGNTARWKILLLLVIAGSLIALCIAIYYMKHLIDKRHRMQASMQPNVPGKEELDKAYTFQRCSFPDHHRRHGLRLRSNTSKRSIPAVLLSTATENLSAIGSAIRKLSSAGTPRSVHPTNIKKTKLIDKFSRDGSLRYSESSVFLPMEDDDVHFEIYHSQSCDQRKELTPGDAVFRETSPAVC